MTPYSHASNLHNGHFCLQQLDVNTCKWHNKNNKSLQIFALKTFINSKKTKDFNQDKINLQKKNKMDDIHNMKILMKKIILQNLLLYFYTFRVFDQLLFIYIAIMSWVSSCFNSPRFYLPFTAIFNVLFIK